MIKEVYFTEVKWKPTHDDLGGVSGKIVFKKPVSYQDYLSISRKEYLLLDENKDKEIERLNNIINELENRDDVLEEFEDWLERQKTRNSEWDKFVIKDVRLGIPISYLLNKLQELKGSDSNGN